MKQKKKHLPIILLILGCLLLLIEVARIIAEVQVKKVLKVQIENLKKRGIQVDYANVQIGLFNRSVVLSQINVSALNEKNSVFHATIRKINLVNIDIKKVLFLDHLDIRKLNISGVEVETHAKYKLKTYNKPEDEKSKLRSIKIHNIVFDNIEWRRWDANDSLGMITDLNKLMIDGFRIDSLQKKPLKYEFEGLSSADITMKMDKGKHKVTIQKAHYDESKQDLLLDSISVIPQYSKADFPTYFDHQVDRITAYSKSIHLLGLTLWDQNSMYLRARKLLMDFQLEVYRDKINPNKKTTLSELPSDILRKFKVFFNIDTLEVNNSFVAYEELNKKERDPGRIFFSNLNINAYNFTNDASKLSNILNVKARFMDKGLMDVQFTFPFNNIEKYKASGHIAPFQLTELNSILKSAVLIEVKSGLLDTLSFQFTYDDKLATGRVNFSYKELKVNAFKPKNPDKVAIFKTIAINQLIKINKVINADLTGKINYPRSPMKSVFSYWWKSLLSGLKAAFIKDGNLRPNRRATNSPLPEFD